MARGTLTALALLLCSFATPLAAITLGVGATSLPEGSVENITVSGAPMFSKLTITSSDPSIVAAPASVTVSYPAQIRALFRKSGTATLSVAASDGSTATATLTVTPGAVLTPLGPSPILAQAAGSGGQSATVTFVNSGTAAFSGSLTGSTSLGVTPSSLALAPGASAAVTFTSRAMPAGEYSTAIALPQRTCCPVAAQTFTVRVESLQTNSAGTVGSSDRRVDIAAPADSMFALGSVFFTNSSGSPITGRVVSDVAWLTPLVDNPLTIAPGRSEEVSFGLSREQRPDVLNPVGSEVGTLSFVYATAAGTSSGAQTSASGSTTSVSVVVVDTITLPTSPSSIPPLAPGEVALLVPGVGNVLGSVGQFVSDLSLLNVQSLTTARNLRFFFAPAGTSGVYGAVLNQLLPLQTVRFADVTSPFGEGLTGGAGKLGLFQLRLSDVNQLGVAASVFNATNAAGTYGTGIPVFRSDRCVTPGQRLYLVGIRADAGAHTNFYIQEAAGLDAQVAIRFLDAHGQVLGTRSGPLSAWQLWIIPSKEVPSGVVSAELQHTGARGAFIAFATPVDVSGDTWVVADWARQYGAQGTSGSIVPVAGVVHGAANTYFRTDLAVMNTGSKAMTATLRFIARDGSVTNRSVDIEPFHTFVSADVVSTLFNATTDTAGFLVLLPGGGSAQMTSRTFTTRSGLTGSYGTAVPSLTPAYALRAGERRHIAAVEEARRAAVNAATPATYRTNFGLIETAGVAATVRVTLRYVVPGALTAAHVTATRDYPLAPSQYMQVSVRDLFGSATADFDFHNATLEFAVISGGGSVIPYVSSVDNGTGDSVLRVD